MLRAVRSASVKAPASACAPAMLSSAPARESASSRLRAMFSTVVHVACLQLRLGDLAERPGLQPVVVSDAPSGVQRRGNVARLQLRLGDFARAHVVSRQAFCGAPGRVLSAAVMSPALRLRLGDDPERIGTTDSRLQCSGRRSTLQPSIGSRRGCRPPSPVRRRCRRAPRLVAARLGCSVWCSTPRRCRPSLPALRRWT